MPKPFYPMAKPSIGPQEKKLVREVLDSGILSLGPKLKEFEASFAKFCGVPYAVAVNSGTSGLHLALLSAGIGAGDEVITTPFSFIASSNCILYVGAKPIFVDIAEGSYNMDPQKIEAAITKKTKAILVVHIFGQSAHMEPILKIAKKHKLKIIEDACESIGATHHGKKVGTWGESAVFAFYPNKQMTTGEGGMVITKSKKVADYCRSLANQGRSANMSWLDHQYLGYNYRMDEMSAAVGIAQIKRLPAMIKQRQQVASWYTEAFRPYPDFVTTPQTEKGNTNTWFVYVVQLPEGANRDKIIEQLSAEGVSAKPYFPSIHLFSFYKKTFGFRPGSFARSEAVSKRAIALPFYIDLKKNDIEYISKTLISILKKYGKRN